MKHQELIFTNDVVTALKKVLGKMEYNKAFVLTDVNTKTFVYDRIEDERMTEIGQCITILAGDVNKNIEGASAVWKALDDHGATRNSVLVNMGGGMVTDLGGFAASSFKRGIRFVNVPTTLLGAVDAAVGGKTGINFNGLKNEIGIFNEASAVIISSRFFNTLPLDEVKSGFAEMLKHGLLSNAETFNRLLEYDFSSPCGEEMLDLLKESVNVKRQIVIEDPLEQGLRRALNLGHTVGHAFESYAMKRMSPIPHGYAVAWGIIAELVLSHIVLNFDSSILERYAKFVYENYGAFEITCDDYPALLDLMRHDKKSHAGEINFTLLKAIGDVQIDCVVDDEQVKVALDLYRDLVHI